MRTMKKREIVAVTGLSAIAVGLFKKWIDRLSEPIPVTYPSDNIDVDYVDKVLVDIFGIPDYVVDEIPEDSDGRKAINFSVYIITHGREHDNPSDMFYAMLSCDSYLNSALYGIGKNKITKPEVQILIDCLGIMLKENRSLLINNGNLSYVKKFTEYRKRLVYISTEEKYFV